MQRLRAEVKSDRAAFDLRLDELEALVLVVPTCVGPSPESVTV